MNQAEADIIIQRLDDSRAYLEVFCVMPQFDRAEGQRGTVRQMKTHMQNEMASIRQKLLRKIAKQRQFSKQRENYAVIELNDISIAGDFSLLSSLSSGYKVTIDPDRAEISSAGFDWDANVFDDPSTEFLKAVIYFSLGDYGSRKFLFNPRFREGHKKA